MGGQIIIALANPTRRALAEAVAVLDRYNRAIDGLICYLMDMKGHTLVSSNRHEPGSFVGKNYAFRPSLQDAMAGWPGHYFSMRVTSGPWKKTVHQI